MDTKTESPQPSATFESIVARLSRQSVERNHDAYADIPWDDPDMAIDPDDPRFELPSFDAVSRTDWYRRQAPGVRSRVGLHRLAATMRIGWEFENVLQRGLLAHAFWMPNGRVEFRYMHHEIIEESQHTLMFQEFVNRTGMDVRGMPWTMKFGSGLVVRMAKRLPALFFLFVLGGEDPVDHLQRRALREPVHPLVERIIRIHLAEEARHLSFARSYLKTHVPTLPAWRRHALSVIAPVLYGTMARIMVYPPPSVMRSFQVPRAEVRAALRHPDQRRVLADSVAKTRRTCAEVGLMTPLARRIWKLMGVAGD